VFTASGNFLNHHVVPLSYQTNGLFTQRQIRSYLKYHKLHEPVVAVGTMMSKNGVGIYTSNDDKKNCAPNVRNREYLCILHRCASLTNE